VSIKPEHSRAPEPCIEQASLTELFASRREQLRRMTELRMDRRISGRCDASDVLQEAFFEASRRYGDYCRAPSMSPFIWLRFLVCQQLTIFHRRHLGVQARDAGREIPLRPKNTLEANSESLAEQLLSCLSTPSAAAIRAERQDDIRRALDNLSALDREMLALRHFEQLSNVEIAEVLDIQPRAASARYLRAIGRLREELDRIPGFFD
jgi:RNA polymerase sigma-70 factor (ECF subfamily)